MDFQQSQTYSNLQTAYQQELMASTKYSIYGDIARQEGYIEIGSIYNTYSLNNKEHARIWLRQIYQGALPSTEDVILDSIETENTFSNDMYREFARIALEEGYTDIASLFNGVANIDISHAAELRSFYTAIILNQVFCKPNETLWVCMQCGNIMYGECAPEICPVCGFPQGYYRVFREQI